MLVPRLIPVLLIHDRGLVKTTSFKDPKYVGDPLNAVRIFNEKEVDELIVLDIDASVRGAEPDYRTIEHLAAECRMPLCYGGGIKTAEQAQRILSLGVEKVSLSSVAIENPRLISDLAGQVGRQSVVVTLDARKRRFGSLYDVVTHNGTRNTHRTPVDVCVEMEKAGAGEIVVNSVDRDGTMRGYDLDLIRKVKEQLTIPTTAVGGAGSLAHVTELYRREKLIGAAAGSMFVFKGKYRAVLISYPSNAERVSAFGSSIPSRRAA
jgi:cyclase